MKYTFDIVRGTRKGKLVPVSTLEPLPPLSINDDWEIRYDVSAKATQEIPANTKTYMRIFKRYSAGMHMTLIPLATMPYPVYVGGCVG